MARPKGHKLSPPAFDDALRAAGINLTEAAERADIPRATVSGLLGGHARASVPMTNKLALALGFNAQTLFPTLRPCYSETEETVESAA